MGLCTRYSKVNISAIWQSTIIRMGTKTGGMNPPFGRHHEEPDVIGCLFLAAQVFHHALVIMDAVERRDGLVAPAVIQKQFAFVREERLHVRIGSIDQTGIGLLDLCDVAVQVHAAPVPLGIFIDDISETVGGHGGRLFTG